jgi:zinc protease
MNPHLFVSEFTPSKLHPHCAATQGDSSIKRWAVLLCSLLLSLTLWAEIPSQTPAVQTGHGIVVSTLPNGLTVVVKPDHRAPTAVHMLWVRVGSMDEVDGYSGIAHILEHMMFKGTPEVPAGEFSRKVAALGGRENAFTNRDYTGFFQQIPAHQLHAVMALEADRFAHNEWNDTEFLHELEVVKEERRMRTDDQPRSQLYEQLQAAQWLASPYRRPIIGWMSDLDAMQPQDARNFYHAWYAPNNAVLVVVGDVDPADVQAQAQKLYGQLPAQVLPPRRPQVEPEQKGERHVSLKAPAEQAYVMMSWKVPGLKNFDDQASTKEAMALTVLSAVLDGYDGARLDKNLTQGPHQVALQAGSDYDLMGRGPQVFMLEGVPKKGVSMETLQAKMKAEIEHIANHGVSEHELKLVKAQWVAQAVFKRDSLFNQAQEIGTFWSEGLPLDTSDRMIDPLLRVTSQEVQAVAKKYFTNEHLSTAYLWPEPLDAATLKRQEAAKRMGDMTR